MTFIPINSMMVTCPVCDGFGKIMSIKEMAVAMVTVGSMMIVCGQVWQDLVPRRDQQ